MLVLRLFRVFLLVLAALVAAKAQEVHPQAPACWFTDQVLAPRSDWYRPDLAAVRVCQVTRTFKRDVRQSLQLLGNRHQAAQPGQSVREVLSYDTHGYLVRYSYALRPRKLGRSGPVLGNQFRYDAQHRVREIQINGTTALQAVADLFSSKAYARWRKPDASFRARHRLPPWNEFREFFPDTWQLRSITCDYDAAGRAQLPRAVVAFTSHTTSNPDRPVVWADTVPLDPRRDWHLATPDTLAGAADTAWLYQPGRWWQPRVPTAQTPGLRLQHLPPNDPYVGRPRRPDYDYGDYFTSEASYGITSFFGPTGQLLLARMLGDGTVWRYRYDGQGQPQRVEAYFMHLPHRYGDTLYFGSVHPVVPIPDCEQRQREALSLPDGEQAVRELLWVQEVQYERNKQGLPSRAIVRTTTPHYAEELSFDNMVSYVRPTGHDGPLVLVKNWRQVKAMLERRDQFRARGCVPMKLTTADTQVIMFRYK
ncbi:hypothetical protein [Hymenobacter metallicola]|uniref:Uncharacterized protein n=1 Tax=Hymenobacter metallicola TaxID=2563114 RepID=A0A4Z0QCX2_9BACT|nr:hypothetical protein [Hymenobacter metallicola]TGE26891.1 hypothetical protein E5K02_10815 [Hymenobacter metallicola]